MESCRILDPSRSPRGGRPLSRPVLPAPLSSLLRRGAECSSDRTPLRERPGGAIPRLSASLGLAVSLVLAAGLALPAAPAQAPAAPSLQSVERLAQSQSWSQIVALLGPVSPRAAELEYYYASALFHLGRFPEAERAFAAGERLLPRDPRFPVELAGTAFRERRYPAAIRHLRRALALAPGDPYANEFLATVYFLQGNLPAALKYWNRVERPQIREIREDPAPRVDPALLSRAVAFSPSSTLTLRQYLDTAVRTRALGIFPQFQIDLRARDDGSFDVNLRNRERNGFGDTRLEAIFLLLRELPFQGVSPSYFNLGRQAININSLYRWDAQKRRVLAEISGPFEHTATHRWVFNTDLRSETWAIRNGFTGPAPVLASLNLRNARASFLLASHAGERLEWSAGVEGSRREYRNVVPGELLTPDLLGAGYQLKQLASIHSMLLRLPEHRFTLDSSLSSEAGRLWSTPTRAFEKLQGSLGWRWSPQEAGDRYETWGALRAGRTFGSVPFDELYMLGLERDNGLPMRAHIGTRDGRKGSAPLGRDYVLNSWDADRSLYSNGVVQLRVGPLLDIGRMTDPNTALGSGRWLFDTGLEVRFRVFATTVAFSWGRDLHAGHNAFYVTLE